MKAICKKTCQIGDATFTEGKEYEFELRVDSAWEDNDTSLQYTYTFSYEWGIITREIELYDRETCKRCHWEQYCIDDYFEIRKKAAKPAQTGATLNKLVEDARARVWQSINAAFCRELTRKENSEINKAIYNEAERRGMSVYDLCFGFIPRVTMNPIHNEGKVEVQIKITFEPIAQPETMT